MRKFMKLSRKSKKFWQRNFDMIEKFRTKDLKKVGKIWQKCENILKNILKFSKNF